ncbi:MAG TPA: kelch repeat-containing protein, partial [Nitrospiria bacterium]|nr:kelch repeat-containing protein [Nitrospiria bacterium]
MMEYQHRWLILSLILLLIGCADPQKEDSVSNNPLPPGQWIQTTPNPSPSARIMHAMVYDRLDHQVILFGGLDANGALDDTWIYNPSTHQWTELFPISSPPARAGHAMVYDESRSRVILFGGKGLLGFLNDTWAYDPGTNTWTPLSPGTSPPERAL